MPHFIKPLREEIENVIAEDGWTKTAMGKMWKLDSFMRESQRYNGINTSMLSLPCYYFLPRSDAPPQLQ